MNQKIEIILSDAEATEKFGENLAHTLLPGMIIFLRGDLGAGKTTLVRGILRGLGYEGRVKSPTYTLVEPYQVKQQQIFHFDLYRLNDPQELIYIGIEDYCRKDAICIIEWPEKAFALLPVPSLVIEIQIQAEGRLLQLQDYSLPILKL